jgi:hypothetical protein
MEIRSACTVLLKKPEGSRSEDNTKMNRGGKRIGLILLLLKTRTSDGLM